MLPGFPKITPTGRTWIDEKDRSGCPYPVARALSISSSARKVSRLLHSNSSLSEQADMMIS